MIAVRKDEGAKRRDAGMAMAASAKPNRVTLGRLAMLDALLRCPDHVGTIDDGTAESELRSAYEDAGKWGGMIVRSLAQDGLIERVGYVESRRPSRHCGPVGRWRLVDPVKARTYVGRIRAVLVPAVGRSSIVGRFRCDSGGLAVGDPCYLSDPRLSLRLKDAKAGSWIVTVCGRRFEDAGERVVSLTVTHESATGVASPWRDSGAAIGVDTGHVAVCDARSLIGPDHAPVRSAVVLDRGVLSAAGFGDWIYPCFIQESGGEIVGVEIRFIDESEGGDA